MDNLEKIVETISIDDYDENYNNQIINDSIAYLNKIPNIIIAIEECGEFLTEFFKMHLANEKNDFSLHEEFVDLYYSYIYAAKIYNCPYWDYTKGYNNEYTYLEVSLAIMHFQKMLTKKLRNKDVQKELEKAIIALGDVLCFVYSRFELDNITCRKIMVAKVRNLEEKMKNKNLC